MIYFASLVIKMVQYNGDSNLEYSIIDNPKFNYGETNIFPLLFVTDETGREWGEIKKDISIQLLVFDDGVK